MAPIIPNYASLAKGGINGLRIGIVTESLHTEHTDERYAKSVVDAAMKFKELGGGCRRGSLYRVLQHCRGRLERESNRMYTVVLMGFRS